jgi:hypothetical protein
MAKKVERIQGEIDSLDAEITQLESSKKSPSSSSEVAQVSSLKQVRATFFFFSFPYIFRFSTFFGACFPVTSSRCNMFF